MERRRYFDFSKLLDRHLFYSTLVVMDGLVLNIATDDEPVMRRAGGGKKGGRWTDRYVVEIFAWRLELTFAQSKSKESSEA